MVLIGAVVLPHGTMSFDGQGVESSSQLGRERYKNLPKELQKQVSGLFDATTKACEKIADLKPDIVILHTPHGVSLSRSVGIYLNTKAKGNALWNEEWDEFEVDISLDPELAMKIIKQFEKDQIDAQGMNCFARTEAPLRWGEVVPLWYLEEQFKKSSQKPKYAIISQAVKREDFDVEMKAIGRSLAHFISQVEARVVLAVSGDLSHAHSHNYNHIPLYLPDPRWNMPQSDTSEVFDRAVEGWASSCDVNLITSKVTLPSYDKAISWDVSSASVWLNMAVTLQPQALSCGIRGFIALHEVLSQCHQKILSQVFGRFAPTYYGMIAVVFSLS